MNLLLNVHRDEETTYDSRRNHIDNSNNNEWIYCFTSTETTYDLQSHRQLEWQGIYYLTSTETTWLATTQTTRITMYEFIALRPQRRHTVGSHTGSSNYNEWMYCITSTETTYGWQYRQREWQRIYCLTSTKTTYDLQSHRQREWQWMNVFPQRPHAVGNHTDNPNDNEWISCLTSTETIKLYAGWQPHRQLEWQLMNEFTA